MPQKCIHARVLYYRQGYGNCRKAQGTHEELSERNYAVSGEVEGEGWSALMRLGLRLLFKLLCGDVIAMICVRT